MTHTKVMGIKINLISGGLHKGKRS
jgi:hypothetical protein